MSSRYTVESAGNIALVAAIFKTVLLFRLTSAEVFRIIELGISFDGQVATNEPILVQLVASDGTTNGTATAHTLFQSGGISRGVVGIGERNFTVEPTTLDVIKPMRMRPDGGLVILQAPLGREVEQFRGSGNGFGIRIQAPDNVNFTGWMEIEQG